MVTTTDGNTGSGLRQTQTFGNIELLMTLRPSTLDD